jgi:hypothetical protein
MSDEPEFYPDKTLTLNVVVTPKLDKAFSLCIVTYVACLYQDGQAHWALQDA